MKYLIMCIGNRDGGDDAIGPYIADRLQEDENLVVLDCGIAPENYTSVVRKHNPDMLILVDAADMGLSPGSHRIVPSEKVSTVNFSTHNIPLSIFVSYVSELCGEVVLIGIQPEKMNFGTVLSSAVQENGDRVAELIIEDKLDEIEPLKA